MIADFFYSFREVRDYLGSDETDSYIPERQFSSITNSSIEVEPGSLFVPLLATRDGHEFIQDSIRKGASGFLYNRDNGYVSQLEPELREMGIPVSNTWTALADLARIHRRRFDPTVIAITGSSGKTTTKELIAKVFSHYPSEELVVTEKNYNNEIGLPFTLFRLTEKTKIAILELGMNHRGEILRLSSIAEPNYCLITTIGSAHIENLGSPEEIAREKSDIVRSMRFLPKPGCLFVPEDISYPEIVEETVRETNEKKNSNAEESNTEYLKSTDNEMATGESNGSGIRIRYWSLPEILERRPNGYKLLFSESQTDSKSQADSEPESESESKMDANSESKSNSESESDYEFEWNQPGDKILSNLAGAVAVGRELQVPLGKILENIKTYAPEGSRLKIIQPEAGDYLLIDDTYNANPESMESSILTAKQMANGSPLLCILGDMKELGTYSKHYHRKIGDLLRKEKISAIFSFGEEARWISSAALGSRMEAESESVGEWDAFPEASRILHFPMDSVPERIAELSLEWKHRVRQNPSLLSIPSSSGSSPIPVILVKGSRSMKMERIVEKILAMSPSR